MRQYQIHIGGAWRDSLSGQWFDSHDPFTNKPWAAVPRCTAEDADLAVTAAHKAFREGPWPSLSASRRGALLAKLGDLLLARAADLARLESRDNGKRLAESLPQIEYLASWFHYYGGLADKVEGAVLPSDQPDIFNYTLYEPLGVVAAITPWNSPLMIGIWKLAPALAAGNTVVIKPSEHASVSTLEFMRLIEEAEVPPGVVNVVTGFAQEVGEALVAHPRVAKVSFTGSDKAGRQVNRAAADDFKRVTLEMGGKSPQIVFEDADLESAVHGVVSGIFLSNGQTCVAGSRLLVQDTIKEAFLEKLTAIARAARMGDPTAPDTQIGPIANRPQHDKILDYIEIAKAEGARCILGGKPAERPECGEGLFVEPTIFVDVTPEMRIAREEVFGPLLAVIPFRDEDEAIAIANDSLYGLAAGVWTKDLRRAHLMARRLESGTVYVNTYRSVSVTSPVGGYKHSGFGRENGAEAIKEFLQIKSVWINMAEKTQNPFAPAGT